MNGPRTQRLPLDERLLRLADGDRSVFDEVYAEVAPRVDALCAKLIGAGPDAEDAAQQALLKCFERIDQFDPTRGSAVAWILTITTWEARTVRKRRSRRREEALDEATSVAAEDPEGEFAATWCALLEEGLGTLQPLDRETVRAALGQVERPDTAPATFRKRLQRATARLREALGGLHG